MIALLRGSSKCGSSLICSRRRQLRLVGRVERLVGLVQHAPQNQLDERFRGIVRPAAERLEDVNQFRLVGQAILDAAVFPDRALDAAAAAAVELEAPDAFVEPFRRPAAGDQVERDRADAEEIGAVLLALQEDDLRLLAILDLIGARRDLHANRRRRGARDDVLDDVADASPVPAEEHAVALLDEAAAELGIADVEKHRVVANIHFDVGDVEVLLLLRRAEMERPQRQVVDRVVSIVRSSCGSGGRKPRSPSAQTMPLVSSRLM